MFADQAGRCLPDTRRQEYAHGAPGTRPEQSRTAAVRGCEICCKGACVTEKPRRPGLLHLAKIKKQKVKNNPHHTDHILQPAFGHYMRTLPDLVRPRMKAVFVGTNPGAKSARIGHYFAGSSNMFWKLLHESNLTEERLTTELDGKLAAYGYGLTDVVKRPTRSTSDLRRHDGNGARNRLDFIIGKNKPGIVVFVGKTGFRYYLGENNKPVKYGIQKFKIAESYVYLLPSTSGQSYADTSYREKLFWYRRLKNYIMRFH